ncbi:hypothetical protein N8642_04740 [bacterium]|nr:hypothetical protein [bacterium]
MKRPARFLIYGEGGIIDSDRPFAGLDDVCGDDPALREAMKADRAMGDGAPYFDSFEDLLVEEVGRIDGE